ncbi:hypothetical protein [Pseudoruegeria sp. HB172150]|uniref:hypothetical protein n=1 Tax=Pseudoruegeria sp. HB172150 TaxID=2721164 RepID=UPI001C12CFCF|nr:hypothetical protein [Pseudoruegeria sp. HB172150]
MEALDNNGRPLLEGRSLRWSLPPENYRTCRYPGQRHGHSRPMNVGALQQFMASRRAVLAYLDSLSQAVAARLGLTDPLHLTLRVSHAAYHAPKLCLLACSGPQAPNSVMAIAAKLGHGVYEGCLGVLMRAAFACSEATPAAIADHAEAVGQLIGRKEVCAGPRHLMIEVIGAMQSGLDTAQRSDVEDHRASVILAQHLWRAETLAHGNAYAALALRARTEQITGFNALLRHARVTFPNALEIVQAVTENRAPRDGFLRAYTEHIGRDGEDLVSCSAALDMAHRVLRLTPDNPVLEVVGGSLRRMSLAAFAQLDDAIVASALAPSDVTAMSPALLDMFFGPHLTSNLATPLCQRAIAT